MTYNKAEDISKNFCIMPWIGVATDPSGGIHPCCWMSLEDMYKGDIQEYQTSDYLNNLKTNFLQGKWPTACERCKASEENGLDSKRIRENYQWQNDKKGDWNNLPDEFQIIDLRLSNRCNLGCISCIPKSSSFIFKEMKKHGIDAFPKHYRSSFNFTKDNDLINPYTDNDIDNLTNLIGENSRIYITGGEPSLIKKVSALLHSLREKGYNKSVRLQFNSNFQAFNSDWVDLLKDFKGEMWPSLDGIGNTAEYVRYPCNWNRVETNLKRFIKECPHWDIRIMPTVSILSIFNLLELHKWVFEELVTDRSQITNRKIRISVNNRLFQPKYLDIRNLPSELKDIARKDLETIKEKYGQYESMFKYLDHVMSHLDIAPEIDFKETIDALERVDKVRNTDWKEIYPQIAKFLKDTE
jgi:sulfatase maturation enzyme AslB (radical SAM superfamily)